MKKDRTPFLWIEKAFFILIAVLLISGCATSYHLTDTLTLFPSDTLNLQKKRVTILCSEIDIFSAKNKRLGTKLSKAGYVLVPVKIINTGNSVLTMSSDNIEFINDYAPVEMLQPDVYLKEINQKLWPNLLYIPVILVTSYKKDIKEVPGQATYVSTGFKINFLSGAIALWSIVNTGRTFYANITSRKDLIRKDLYNKNILPGSIIYGFICVRSEIIKNPMVRIKDK